MVLVIIKLPIVQKNLIQGEKDRIYLYVFEFKLIFFRIEEAEEVEPKKNKPVVMHFSTPTPQAHLPFPLGVRVGGGSELDPELPCPNNP